MNNNPWYYLDPDNRKDRPAEYLFCCRCQKAIKNWANVVMVELHHDHPWVRIDHTFMSSNCQIDTLDKGLIGSDCWKIITAAGPVEHKDNIIQ